MKYKLFSCFALFIFSTAALALPTVSGTTISWPDDGWYQVQVVKSDGIFEVCQGGRSCEVIPGEYIVINLSTGERFDRIQVFGHSGSGRVTVTGNTLHWLDDGWYQVQEESTYSEVCSGGRSCTVEPGSYVVINHTTGERFENIKVELTLSGTDSPITVVGNKISWSAYHHHQVLRADNYQSVCDGGRSCLVPPGVYIVINHHSGQRYNGIVVSEDSPPLDNTTQVKLVSYYESDLSSLRKDASLSGLPSSVYKNALSEDGQSVYFNTAERGVSLFQNSYVNPDYISTYRYGVEQGGSRLFSLSRNPDYFSMGADGHSGFFLDDVTFRAKVIFFKRPGSITLKNLVPGNPKIVSYVMSRDAKTLAFVTQESSDFESIRYNAYVYDVVNSSLVTVSQELTALKDGADSDVNWQIRSVSSISDSGDIVAFNGDFSPGLIEDISGLVLNESTMVYDRGADTVDLIGKYSHRIYGSSPTFARGFLPIVSADGMRVIYNALPELRWGSIAYDKQGYVYDVNTGEEVPLEGMVGFSDVSFSQNLDHMVGRLGSSIIYYQLDTGELTTLSTQVWGYCGRACLPGQSNRYNPGMSADGSTVLFFERVLDDESRYPSHTPTRLMLHDVNANTTMPITDVIGDMDTKMPYVSPTAFNAFDLSADGQTIVVSAFTIGSNDAYESGDGAYNVYLLKRPSSEESVNVEVDVGG